MPELAIGLELVYDGDRCQIVEIQGGAVVLVDSRSRARRVRLIDLLKPAEQGGLAQLPRDSSDDKATDENVLFGVQWATATPTARAEAHRLAEHIRELETGYRSGSSEIAGPDEPRPQYDVGATTIGQRERSKAEELGKHVRTIQNWRRLYRDLGEPGLLDGRAARHRTLLKNLDPAWLDTCNTVLDDLEPLAKRDKTIVIGWIEDRVQQREARGDYGGRAVRRPSRTTINEVLRELDRGRGLFTGPTSTKRSRASGPDGEHGRNRAVRPGEYLLLDTTKLNLFAMDATRGSWDPVELTSALDLANRTVRGIRLTPRSSKSVDVSSILFEAMQPFEPPSEWSSEAVWPYGGMPKHLVVNTEKIKVARFWTAEDEKIRRDQIAQRRAQEKQIKAGAFGEGLLPETIIVDHGKVYVSEHLTNFCARNGISIQPARLGMGVDKAQKERWYGTFESLIQELPGYKGRSVAGRGSRPESEVVYTIQQLEQILREWIATVYHHAPHSELFDPHLPGVFMTPLQAYEHGVAMSGRLRVPFDRNLLIEMLPIELRYFNHYGVEINGLTYTGPIVAKYRNRSRVISSGSRGWPFHFNPDDMTRIYFHDPDDRQWHTLLWNRAAELNMPFGLDALEYAKSIAETRAGKKDVERALVDLLRRLGISRGDNPREKLIAARAVAQAPDPRLPLDQPTSLSTVRRLLDAHNAANDPPLTGESPTQEMEAAPTGTHKPPLTPREDFYDDDLEDL